uniref:Uncharacterized protein n=1 Tax=Anguilla anguilla TaxID=7936 RepID=A0A0E9V379_ANGAN
MDSHTFCHGAVGIHFTQCRRFQRAFVKRLLNPKLYFCIRPICHAFPHTQM